MTATSFEHRLAVGLAHEDAVQARLREYGWEVSPWGQGILTPLTRDALKRTDSSLRQMPDFIAARDDVVVLIDAKARMTSPNTGRHAISTQSLRVHNMLACWADLPFYYVFDNWGVQTPHDVLCGTRTGPHLRIGEGAYLLVPVGLDRPFDDIFGA